MNTKASFRNFGKSSSYDRVAAVEIPSMDEPENGRHHVDPLDGDHTAGTYYSDNNNNNNNNWTDMEETTTNRLHHQPLGTFEIGGLEDDVDNGNGNGNVVHDNKYYDSDDDADEGMEGVDLKSNAKFSRHARKRQDGLSMMSVSTTTTTTTTTCTAASSPHHFRRPPSNYCCPLTLHIMDDPVADGCGHCFDRDAISSWLEYHSFCPISRKPLEFGDLIPATALQERIQQWQQVHRSLHLSSEPDLTRLAALSDTTSESHSQVELMLLPQERQVLSIIKFRKQARMQREAWMRLVWTVVAIVTICFVTITFSIIYIYDVELRGPL